MSLERTDQNHFAALYTQATILKLVALVLLLVIGILAITCFALYHTPPRVVVVSPSGQTNWSDDADEKTYQNLAIHDAKDFIENLHSNDAIFGPAARKKAAWYLAPKIRKELGSSIDDSGLLAKMITSEITSRIRWIIPPRIVGWSQPNSRIYGQFEISNRAKDGTTSTEAHHIIVDGTFFGSTQERPSGYFVTRFKYLTDTKDIDDVLNSIGGKK
jgi:hypothetical protein